jgi:hypothetical protein
VLVADPARGEERAEVLGTEEVALDLVLQVLPPVEPDRAGDVRIGVERRVLVDLDDADRRVVQVLGQPVGLDEHVIRVVSHADLLGNPVGFQVFRSSVAADAQRPRPARSALRSRSIPARAAATHAA